MTATITYTDGLTLPRMTAMQVLKAADRAQVNDALLGFEDGLIREVWLESGMWLTRDDTVVEQGYWAVTVLVQVQTAPTPAALLRFEGVTGVEFLAHGDMYPARAHDVKAGWEAEFLGCRITAAECSVELLGEDWMGRGPFLRNQVT